MADLRTQILKSNIGKIIHILDEIKEITNGLTTGLTFPQVIVVGQESSGKSSVLERISMLQFFPRGEQITTRMPIKLEMKHKTTTEMEAFCKENNLDANQDAWIRLKYTHQNGKVIYSPNFVSYQEVENLVKGYMDQAVSRANGKLAGIINDELSIEIISHQVPNLTLVDLPGIFGARYENEPMDVKKLTKKLVEKYLVMPHTIVLAILPANERIRNSAAMHLLQKHNKVEQTIGVLTKADLAYNQSHPNDPYYALKEKLEGKSADYIHLPRGYVAVRNRDDSLQVSFQQSVSEERLWFDTYLPGYYSAGKVGNDNLIAQISSVLQDYVQNTWIDSALHSITEIRTPLQDKFHALGEVALHPDTMTISIFTWIAENFRKQVSISYKKFEKLSTKHSYTKAFADTIDARNIQAVIDNVKQFESIKNQGVGIFTDLRDQLIRNLENLLKDSTQPLVISRFYNFRERYIAFIKEVIHPTCLIEKNAQTFRKRFSAQCDASPLDIIKQIFIECFYNFYNYITTDPKRIYVEFLQYLNTIKFPKASLLDESCAQERAELSTKLAQIAAARSKIMSLE